MMTNDVAELVRDLRRVLAGEFDHAAFGAKYEDRSFAELDAVWHGLQHYFADADIRARDAGYREMQESEMLRVIKALEGGATAAALGEPSFLPSHR